MADTNVVERGAIKSPFGLFSGRRKGAAAEPMIDLPIETVKSEHRKSLDGLRQSIREHADLIREKAEELKKEGAEHQLTAQTLSKLAEVLDEAGRMSIRMGVEFSEFADKMSGMIAQIDALDVSYATADENQAALRKTVTSVTERVKKITPTVH